MIVYRCYNVKENRNGLQVSRKFHKVICSYTWIKCATSLEKLLENCCFIPCTDYNLFENESKESSFF